jgi:hypothetical protein
MKALCSVDKKESGQLENSTGDLQRSKRSEMRAMMGSIPITDSGKEREKIISHNCQEKREWDR